MAKKLAKAQMNEKKSGSEKLQTSEGKEREEKRQESEENDQVKAQTSSFFYWKECMRRS